ncbi:MAG TPA: hypothetical protein VGG07_25090 [Solirubrobacteraceae bacterium]|jgi:hypothetical protein
MTPSPTSDPIAVGQVRADWHGYTVRIDAVRSDGRFMASYPDYPGEHVVLSVRTIDRLYPRVVSG